MTTNQALIKKSDANGNGLLPAAAEVQKPVAAQPAVQPLTEEMVDQLLAGRGFRGWLRAARVARVLGLFSLYLFLDTYDVRADFNKRAVARVRELARQRGRRAQFDAWLRAGVYSALDRFIRVLRFVIFRGAEGSARKEARLEKQAVWMRESLISLGPTFIKIGQALGTRADLLPLAYVKELATLQDNVPAFPTADAFARIEAELDRPLHELCPEIDSEPIAAASLGQVYRARLRTGEEEVDAQPDNKRQPDHRCGGEKAGHQPGDPRHHGLPHFELEESAARRQEAAEFAQVTDGL